MAASDPEPAIQNEPEVFRLRKVPTLAIHEFTYILVNNDWVTALSGLNSVAMYDRFHE